MPATIIKEIRYRTIYDSRGVETLEVDVLTGDGFGRAAAPFGAPGSRGEFEAPAYAPAGLEATLQLLKREIVPALIGMDAARQDEIDAMLAKIDGTPNFERIGGNTSTVISVAAAKAVADARGVPMYRLFARGRATLPYPLGNAIGGGAHSLGPAPDMQEHLIVPVGAKTIRQGVATNLLVHETLGKLLEKKDPAFAGGTDDENAWTADLDDYEALEVLEEAVKIVSGQTGIEIRMGLDLAADRLWHAQEGRYRYLREGKERDTVEQIDYLSQLIERFNLIYVEDGFHSNDYASFAELNKKYGRRCLICADDIYASNVERTTAGIKAGSAGTMIVKTNQVGTITGAARTSALAIKNGVSIVLSHRSGETPDDSIAHLAVAWNALMIKTGVKGGERLAKLNELIRLEVDYPELKLIEWPIK